MLNQLLAEPVDAIDELGEPLIDSPQPLFILSKTSIYALEPLEHLTSHLLQLDHDGRRQCEGSANLRGSPTGLQLAASGLRSYFTPVLNTVLLRYVSLGRSVVLGNCCLFGESGKCCVSRQKPYRCL